MYTIVAVVDGKEYPLHNTKSRRLIFGDPYFEIGDNLNGQAEFKVYPGHPYYDKVKKLTTDIIIRNDGEDEFYGRVLYDDEDSKGVKQIFVEGELAFLCDSIQRPRVYHNIGVRDYLTNVIKIHNDQVEARKHFTVGRVTVEDANDSLYRFSNWETTRETLKDKLSDRLGGHFVIRHENGIRYLDYLDDDDYYSRCTQQIKFGKNLLSFARNFDASELATCIIPLGTTLEESSIEGLDERLTIKSVNGGKDYVTDDAAVAAYGKIYKTIIFDDITLPENLKTKGKKYLTQTQYEKMVLECKAIDLNFTDKEFERFTLGSLVRCVSKPHALDAWYPVTKQRFYLTDFKKNTITLGDESSNVSYTSSNRETTATFREDLETYRTGLTERIKKAHSDFKTAIENANGLFSTDVEQENGSTITYYHNKKDLESSSIRIVFNDAGFAVTNNAGKDWYGIQVDGKFLADILYANGINAGWINTGVLRVTDAEGNEVLYVNVDTGEVRIVASDFSLIGGTTIESIAKEKADEAQKNAQEQAAKLLENFINAVYDPKIAALQAEIDGQIETWYYDYQPTLSNIPASQWTTETDRAKHEGDLFFWKSKGYSYRFLKEGSTWKWQIVTDSEITKALAAASNAQDTADSKRRIFIITPTPPYDQGDLWTQGKAGSILRCIKSRSTGNYVASDWEDASDAINEDEAKKIANDAVDGQTQKDVFDKLTNKGKNKGIYLKNNEMYINGTYMEIGKIASKDGRVYFDLDNSELRCDRIVSESTDSTNANIVGFIGSTYLRSLDGNYSTVNGFTVYNTKNEPGLIAITPGDSSGSKPKISADQSGLAIYSRVPYSQMGSSGVAGISTSNNGYVLLYGGRGRIPTDSNIEGADSNIGGAYIMITPESYKSGSNIYTLSNIYVRGHTYFSGTGVTMSGLEVTGPKSRIVDTEDYGTRALYCYEMPSPMFGDIGEAWLDENGEYYGYLDDIFTETIRTDIEYQVFLQKEGKGDIWVDSKEPAFFVVKGTPGLKFSWEVKAKQIGFEFERLENREVSEMEQLDLDAYDSVYLEELNRVIGEQEGLLYETAW